MYQQETTQHLQIPTLHEPGNEFDVSQLDFSPLGVRVVKIDSTEFIEYMMAASNRGDQGNFFEYNYRMFRNLLEQVYDAVPYAVIPINEVEVVGNYSALNWTLQLPYHILQIICPSNFFIYTQHFFEVVEEGKIHDAGRMTQYPDRSHGSYPTSKFHVDSADNANFVISKYNEFKGSKPFKVGLEIYLNSFNMNHYSMQFLNLIMSFESLISGPQELSYRLKRGIAVLCGESTDSCKMIYDNLNNSYKLRSKIAHGEDYDDAKIHEYLPYLIVLASQYLQEILKHSQNNKDILNATLTQLGYGDKKKISKNYTPMVVNTTDHNLIQELKLSPYK